ncbi:armadillo-type protein [Cunninghamella echinulata]|nr:armadillo-type protein [Cunninghamella echinulata]
MVTSSIGGAPSHYAPSQYSAMDEDTASRVDSMFSSLQSNRSNMRPNPNTPPPLRTVRLDGVANNNNNSGMIQPLRGAPPSPPEQSYHHPFPSSSQSSSLNQSKNNNNNNNLSNPETIEQQFEKIVREYELPDELIKTLTLEKKQELLRNSQVQQNKNNQSLFSWKTLGFQKKQKNRMDIRQEELFDPNDHNSNNNNNNNSSNSNNKKRNHGNYFNDNKSYSTSARGKAQRASVMNPYQKDDKNATIKYDRTMKKGLSPEYFIHVLKDAHVRDLDESLVQDLRVCLRSVKASWTTQFLDLGGYSVISNLFYQMKEAPKRYPNDDKILQHLSKCFKAIMTHKQRGVNLVLTNPIGLVHIRDLLFDLFGANNQKQKELYGLHIITRGHFLNILCSLTNLQTTPSETVPYIHGYDILRRLLLDNSSDYYGETVSTSTSSTSIANTSPSSTSPSPSTSKTNHPASSSAAAIKENNNELPFRMTLKQDPEVIMKMILENDPLYIDGQPFKPRYTAWMRELDYTVEKEIGTITYLSQALDYRFESAFRQMRIKPPTPEQDQINEINNQHGEEEEATGVVMTDDGVVDYLIAHLRLINTIIGSQPTFCDTPYTDRDKEKVRLEIMMSGFDKTSKLLQNCPHPTLLAFYIPFLRTLLHPLADLSLEQQQANMQTVYHQNNTAGISTNDTTTSQHWNENELRQTYEHPTWSNNSFYDDDDEDEENWVDEDESFDYSFDEQMDEYDSQLGDEDDMSTYDQEHRWKTGSSVTR